MDLLRAAGGLIEPGELYRKFCSYPTVDTFCPPLQTVIQAVWVDYSLLRESYETTRVQQRVVHVDSQTVAVRYVPLQWVGLFRIAEIRASNLTRRPVTLSPDSL